LSQHFWISHEERFSLIVGVLSAASFGVFDIPGRRRAVGPIDHRSPSWMWACIIIPVLCSRVSGIPLANQRAVAYSIG